MTATFSAYDDVTRTVTTTVDAVTRPPRPYTAEENADADARAIAAVNAGTIREQIAQGIEALQASATALRNVAELPNAQVGPTQVRIIAREAHTLALALVRVGRLLGNVLDSTNGD